MFGKFGRVWLRVERVIYFPVIFSFNFAFCFAVLVSFVSENLREEVLAVWGMWEGVRLGVRLGRWCGISWRRFG